MIPINALDHEFRLHELSQKHKFPYHDTDYAKHYHIQEQKSKKLFKKQRYRSDLFKMNADRNVPM